MCRVSRIQWLFNASTALYPSVYLSTSGRSSDDQFLFIKGKLREALRVAQGRNYVYPYFWYRYRDAGFLSDVSQVLEVQRNTRRY